MLTLHKERLVASTLFLLLLAITFYSYYPGLNGLFIFDDMPNLSPMGKYKDFSLLDNILLFVLEGDSGPTGRPISLASFFLNDTTWPSQPASFTHTNVLIHLLNGSLVFWVVYKLGEILKLTSTRLLIFALFSASLWILHPFHTTTVLYIVQRMTELSALFMLVGFLFYLYGREIIIKQPKKGLLLLFMGVGISLLLSILSKENGVLLVVYIVVIEFFLIQPRGINSPRYFNYWLIPAILLPTGYVLYYLLERAWIGSGFENRNFSMGERLLTEPRILFDYLHHILLPKVGDMSIFHDDYVVSKSLFTPWTTLPAIIGINSLLIFSILARKRMPLIAFSIIWFLAGHLLESTVLSLELYFEHRNYLPMLGFLITASWYLSKLVDRHRVSLITIGLIQVSLFSFLLIQNATLWSKPVELIANWYQAHPNSMRTQEAYLNLMKPFGVTEKDVINESYADDKIPPYMKMLRLSQACSSKTITLKSLDSTVKVLRHHPIHATTSTALTSFISKWNEEKCTKITEKEIEGFLLEIADLKNTKHNGIFANSVHYWLSEIYRKKKNFNHTMINLDKAYEYSPDSELLKLRVAYLSSAGLYDKALKALSDTSLLETGFRQRIALKIKQKELTQLEETIISIRKKNTGIQEMGK